MQQDARPYGFPTVKAAWIGGAAEAVGSPSLVLAVGYVGFGALARDADIPLLWAAVSALAIWALPAQITLIELWQTGTALPALVLAVMMTSARFLPMTATILPTLAHPRWKAPHYLLATHLVAMTGWAVAMRRTPLMDAEQRLPFFCAFSLTLWATSLLGTVIGYLLSGLLSEIVTLGLVFLNPLYFFLILIKETRVRLGATALVTGAVLGPLVHLWIPEWSLLVGGILAGLIAFAIVEATEPRP